jgi:hypothetical protein
MSETLKRRELKNIAERVNNSGVEKALKHKDFKFIFDYMNQNNVNKIILNTTLTSSDMPIMKYRFDEDTLAKCAVNPRPIGRGYKALKNNVFY